MSDDERAGVRAGGRWPTAIRAIGLLIPAAIVVEWYLFGELGLPRLLSVAHLLELVINGGIAAGLVYGTSRIERSDIDPDRYRRIAGWCFGGLFLFLAVNLALIAVVPASSLEANVAWARGTAVFGAGGGFLVGGIEARSIERARAAERAEARAEYADQRRQWFDYLNSLLRHEVLNKANVIEGNATLILDEVEDEFVRGRVRTIRLQSRRMASVIDDVRALIEATEAPDEFSTRSLTDVLTDAVTDIRRTHEEVEVETSIPADVRVRADGLLERVFSNLLLNAVKHNDRSAPRIRVSVETDDETATVHVADNGPGVPEGQRDTLFERDTDRGSSHGLGLYLVRTLVERYGGSVELTETGPEGSVFTVTLPSAGASDRGATTGESEQNADAPLPSEG